MTNTEYIQRNYKSSTLPRLTMDYGMTIQEINNSELLNSYLYSPQAKKDGYSQDSLFNVLFTETYYGKEVLRNAEPNQLPF